VCGEEREGQEEDRDAAQEWGAPAAQKTGHGSRNARAAARFAAFTRSSPDGEVVGLTVRFTNS